MTVSVHIEKALPDDLGGAFLFVSISSGYVGILGIIHGFQLIAEIESQLLKDTVSIV